MVILIKFIDNLLKELSHEINYFTAFAYHDQL